jgi:acyl transferase domain-containing protein
MIGMDPDNMDRAVVTGMATSLIPNRISFYFDLHGPSMQVDTACSSSLSAFDMACKFLQDGDAETVSAPSSIVPGSVKG